MNNTNLFLPDQKSIKKITFFYSHMMWQQCGGEVARNRNIYTMNGRRCRVEFINLT